MTTISLKELIDDILLLVRNNNISESEDLSRTQIANWIKAHKAAILKERLDKQKENALNPDDDEDAIDNMFIREVGPLEIQDVELLEEQELGDKKPKRNKPTFTKRTVKPIQDIYENAGSSILAIHDEDGEDIQYMNHERRHYNYFRKYTFGELTAYYKPYVLPENQSNTKNKDGIERRGKGYIYIEGTEDLNQLKYIYVLAIFNSEGDDSDGDDDINEEDIQIPAWLVPGIKQRIIQNELAFMVRMPSDDSNNATLASVKPHGPQDAEE